MNIAPPKNLTGTTFFHTNNSTEKVDSFDGIAADSASPAFQTSELILSTTAMSSRQVLPAHTEPFLSDSEREISTEFKLDVLVVDGATDVLPSVIAHQTDTPSPAIPIMFTVLGSSTGALVSQVGFQVDTLLPIAVGAGAGLISGVVCEVALSAYLNSQVTLATQSLEPQSELPPLPPFIDLERGLTSPLEGDVR